MNAVTRAANFLSGKKTSPDSPRPYLFSIRSSKFFILGTICTAVFTDIFLYGIIVPVIPFALSQRAGVAEVDVQQWVSILLAAYGAAMLVGSPLAGWFADNTGSRRLPLLIGLLALAGATLLLCLSRTVALLVLGRILQGLSAAVVWTVGLALMVDTVGQAAIGEMMGYVSISMTLGFMISPLIGGVVYNKAGYYPVYYICFGLIAVDIALRLALIEKRTALQWVDEDVSEESLPSSASADDTPAHSVERISAVNGDLEKQSVQAPQAAQQTEPERLVPTDRQLPRRSKVPPIILLLKSRRLLTALWGITVQASLTTAFDTTLPLFVQATFNWDSIGAGLIFLCLIVPSFLAPGVGILSDRCGPRWLVVGGFIYAVPLWVCLRFVDHNSINQKVLLCALLVLIGVSLVVVMGPLIAEITYCVEAQEKKSPGLYGRNGAYAQAYGLFTMAFSAGTLIGPFWSGYIETAAGWGTMTWTLGVLSAAGALPCLIFTGGLITKDNAKTSVERAAGRPASEGMDAPMQNERQ